MNNLYTGCVESREDPLKLGRCQVRIVGLHTESKVSLPTKDLPWAYPMQPITSAGTSGVGTTPLGPVEGSWVLIVFMDPDQQLPMMLGTLAGSYQTPDAIATGQYQTDTVDPDGTVELSGNPQSTVDESAAAEPGVNAPAGSEKPPAKDAAATTGGSFGGQTAMKDGKVVVNPGQIVGPLGTLIAKAESGAAGYNAYNRGTVGGKIVGGSGKMNLTDMTIREIMALQALPAGNPQRLFAVGKYQCIPSTLKDACKSLNLDVNQKFNERNQDIICQEYLVGQKRKALINYYKSPNRSDEDLLMRAGKSLAAEFASIEDPYFLGYPYMGKNGSYYKSGNRAHTMWARDIKPTLLREWDFRNNKASPVVTANNASLKKVEKGTDYSGAKNAQPVDDSVATAPETTAAAPAPVAPPAVIPGLPPAGVAAAPAVSPFGSAIGELSNALGSISDIAQNIGGILDELDLDLDLDDVLGKLSSLTGGASDILKQFGGTVNEIAANLGIENITGSVAELSANLGLMNATQQDVVEELARIAGSPQGQAAAMLAKIEAAGETSKPRPAPVGAKNSDGTFSNGTGVDPTVGFQDPNGTYPIYRNEPDTNRLATGNNLGRTVILKKEATLRTDVKIANGGTWDQAPVPYNAVYPFNKVTQTESGHIQEWDDTPGSERIHTYHKSGTFNEIDANGTMVNRIVGDGFEIMERNGFVYVKGAYCVTVDGAMNLRTDNVLNLEVSGAANIFVYDNANINVSKDCNLAVGASLNAKANTINLESENQFNIRAGTGLNIQSGKDMNIKSGASIKTESDANISLKSVGAIYSESAGDINHKAAGGVNISSGKATNIRSAAATNIEASAAVNVKAGAALNQQAGGSASIRAGGNVSADAGGIIDLANGSSASAASADAAAGALSAREAAHAELELPIETRGTSGVDRLPPMASSTRSSEVGYDAPAGEGTGDAEPGYKDYQQSRVKNNTTSKTDVEATRYEQTTTTPKLKSASSPAAVTGLDSIHNMTVDQFTPGMKLSKHFTLGDLTKGGVRIPRVEYTVKGITYTPQQIVANLKTLCETTLDPIHEKFGKFTITSGFRRAPRNGKPGDLGSRNGVPIQEGGDHPVGCAADIVFPAGKLATFNNCKEIAEMLGSFNQVIMEYSGGSYWIHVAVKPKNNKNQILTMVNHKTHAAGKFVLV